MTKPLIKITEDQFEIICFWVHKGCRWSEAPGSSELWIAIKNLGGDSAPEEYGTLMKNALREAGIKVIKKVK